MFLFYADETGNRDPRLEIPQKNGTIKPGDWLYVLTAVSLFEHRWHGFEKTINRRKGELTQRILRDRQVRLELADCEVKSNWVRILKERRRHPFLGNLTSGELTDLIELYYRQLEHHRMHIVSVLVDKRHLPDYMDQEKLHRKSWELLLEQVEKLMRAKYGRHQAIMVNDDVSLQANRSLAMKHAWLLDQGTTRDTWLRHICEMPMFVRSELSNGVQLADLCSYNIYRAFRYGDLSYPFFNRIKPYIWSQSEPVKRPFSGLYVFPGGSPLRGLLDAFEKERASTENAEAPDV
ncbi:MAG: DUF3800 domain-containing protein [Planctomycetes bacterium]|nr:DUF3800 domain-containing protein [Planctomycetota bacterium]